MKYLIIILSFFFSVISYAIAPQMSISSLPHYELSTPSYSQDGFCANTLIKTIDGYKPIQDFIEGDLVIDSNNQEKEIVSITKKYVKQYMRLVVNDTIICAGCDQQYCVLPDYAWTPAQDITSGDCLLTHTNEHYQITHAELIRKETFLYSFTIEDHIFYITPGDICVHNADALILGASSIYLGYITIINPIVATIGAATALSAVFHKAYQTYMQQFSSQDQEITLPQEVVLAERTYYEQRKIALENIKQELACITNDLMNIKAMCGNGFTHQLLQQDNITNVCNQSPLLKISAAQEIQLPENKKIDLRNIREAQLKALEQDIIALQCRIALHCNTVIEQANTFVDDYQKAKEQTNITRSLWNKNLHHITDTIALNSYKAELIEEFAMYHFEQKINELKAIVNYYRNVNNKNCLQESTNIIEFLPTMETCIAQWDQEIQKEKPCLLHNLSLSAGYFNRRGISTVGVRNEVKNILEKAQKNNAAKSFAQLQNKLSNMVSSGGPYKDPKKDDEPEKDSESKRIVNTMTKTEFFQKVKDQYEHCGNNLYRRKSGAKGIENAEYLRWDYSHNDVEAYTANRKHLGSINPHTLKLYKGPVAGRKPF